MRERGRKRVGESERERGREKERGKREIEKGRKESNIQKITHPF